MADTATIRVLPDDLINQIAAGEVVERPASVVKELVENAIDAGATEIDIDIESSGRSRIAIRDNGSGMTIEAMKLALLRHATSKISSFDDLFAIHTLGFRGEALPSIASVSRMEIVSRPSGSESAIAITIEGGKVLSERPVSGAIGTRIEIRDLFFNTPARLKFLKGDATEWSHIADYVERVALSHHSVSFSLHRDGKRVLSVVERDNTRARLRQILGEQAAKAMAFFVDPNPTEGYQLSGWVGFPELDRKSAAGLYLFVNGRPIRDKTLQHAVMEAYQGLIMKGRYPVVILDVRVPPNEVDVNAHPAKSEVRFKNAQTMHQWVFRVVRQFLQTRPWIVAPSLGHSPLDASLQSATHASPVESMPDAALTSASTDTPQFDWALPLNARGEGKTVPVFKSRFGERPVATSSSINPLSINPPYPPFIKGEFKTTQEGSENPLTHSFLPQGFPPVTKGESEMGKEIGENSIGSSFVSSEFPLNTKKSFDHERGDTEAQAALRKDVKDSAEQSSLPYTSLRLIGQFHGTYLLCEADGALVLVDQHAAHERIGYESLKTAYRDHALMSEPSLIPIHLELLPSDAAILMSRLSDFERLGIEIAELGETQFAIQSVPVLLRDANWPALIIDMIDEFKTMGLSSQVDEHLDDLFATMACHRQIRANQRLSTDEMQALLSQLGDLDFAYHCPHGRPAAVKVTLAEIEKWFRRRV